ncbi:aspartyl-phosphate phosphatase Spo0E family protein [Paenibacillus sp. N1-5-1-14]|uniref:aspartyl-phosphate phosphatase Spo0E family protein n=1 Tax=Paenibacillus radicibacter TaxID=2972488 RepID=UPI0021591BF0|nr:aspartyl-phosphate phosphatase Spo0E family protein [Paenibacillus radicibacter]MCR8644906.1 aspartyl-phosphate phosphatase Spo0E family protein [Paenibacillus radicibacter]
MAFLEYQLSQSTGYNFVRDSDAKKRWLFKKIIHTATQQELEEQIHALRRKLEKLVQEGHEMTSSEVIETSMQLDLKIIEYMNKEIRSE